MKNINRICLSMLMLYCFNVSKIHSQNTYSFTTAAATGSFGPTQAQINAAYFGTSLAGSVVCPSGMQSFTFAFGGSYQIVAAGAAGGGANAFGGRGRIVQGNYNFTAGDVIRVVVGQKGIWGNFPSNGSSGGGGGSYVVLFNGGINTPIIIGGGGAGFLGPVGSPLANTDANILQPGFNSIDGLGTGGAPGNGGLGSSQWGGGGGGYSTNGTAASACANTGGQAFILGSLGAGSCYNSPGGFGGGAGTHGNTGGGGGGGGYSGGGGSGQSFGNPNGGGGGGSYLGPALTSTINGGLNLNQGYVTITQLCAPALAPTDVTPISNQTLCPNGTTTLAANGTGTLSWYATNVSTLVLGTGSTFVTPTLSPGTYTFFASASNSCSPGPRTPITLTVTNGPTITVNSGAICPGQSFTMNPSGAISYTYSSGSPIVSPTVNTSYTVTGTDISGCINSVGVVSNVTVNPVPVITVNSGSICSGQSFTMFPGGALTYTFSNGSAVVSPTSNVSYSVAGTSAAGCISPLAAVSNITVIALPSVTVTGPNAMCIGQTITLTGFGAGTYSWSNGANTQSIAVSPTASISYSVVGSSGGCGSNSTIKNITVNPIPSVLVSATSTLICKGESVLLTASGVNTYSWNTGALTTTINVTPLVTTGYTVIGTNTTTGCSKTTTISIQVSLCTGLSEATELTSQISLYPNPNSGEFIIELIREANATVYNTLGEVVLTKKLSEGENKIDLKEIAKGIYYVQIRQGDLTKTLKMIKE